MGLSSGARSGESRGGGGGGGGGGRNAVMVAADDDLQRMVDERLVYIFLSVFEQ